LKKNHDLFLTRVETNSLKYSNRKYSNNKIKRERWFQDFLLVFTILTNSEYPRRMKEVQEKFKGLIIVWLAAKNFI
jgi:hypothetical protein